MMRRLVLVLAVLVVAVAGPLGAMTPVLDPAPRSSGQLVYVPVYSHVYCGDRETEFMLAATVVVRNTDPKHSIIVCSADYHNSEGKLVRRYLTEPTRLLPLASLRFVVPESDTAGGVGASVLVTWKATVPTNVPIIESIMIGTQSQQGISFACRGQVLDNTPVDWASVTRSLVSPAMVDTLPASSPVDGASGVVRPVD